MPSGGTIITRALRSLGVLEATETAAAEDLSAGLEALNDLLEDWSLQRGTIYYTERAVESLVAGTASYTIGVGGAFNRARPMTITSAGIILDDTASPTQEVPIAGPITRAEWQGIPEKDATSTYPNRIYYDHSWTAGLGRIYVYPVPTVSTVDLVLYLPIAVTAFANTSTVYTFPPGYARALRYNLALELAPEYDKNPHPDLVRNAKSSLANIKRANVRLTDVGFDAALSGVGREYDIYTDQ